MAEKEEEKGFVVKDRRRFSEEGAGEGEKEARAPEKEEKKAEEPGPQSGDAVGEEGPEKGPFPEVSMATFVFSLSSSALVHLGEIPEPETNISRVDLPIAKQIIDTLGMLQEKTKGNLDPDEERLLRSVLYDLRMRYVQKSSGKN
jgi:Domain of unknown function (DUF1844)